MALKDVKEYYYGVQQQYLEMKQNLVEFESAFKDGHITEDQLETVKEEIHQLQLNYDRLTYILFLLDVPNRPKKAERFMRGNKDLVDLCESKNATDSKVFAENENTLKALREELKRLKNQDK